MLMEAAGGFLGFVYSHTCFALLKHSVSSHSQGLLVGMPEIPSTSPHLAERSSLGVIRWSRLSGGLLQGDGMVRGFYFKYFQAFLATLPSV